MGITNTSVMSYQAAEGTPRRSEAAPDRDSFLTEMTSDGNSKAD